MKKDFEIGDTFMSSGKHKKLCTVSDIHKTYNARGELVKTTYCAFHLFMGQTVRESGICHTTIARGFIE